MPISRFVDILLFVIASCFFTNTSFGDQSIERLGNGQQAINIDYQSSLSVADKQVAHRWLKVVVSAVSTVHGELPLDGFVIDLRKSTRSHSAVPWGHVERRSPTKVVLVVNTDAGFERLVSDWTAYHELSHLFLPYRGYGDLWFSEGLATYLQNVVQARAGLIDEQHMWKKLLAGFERGDNDRRWSHITLSQVSDRMRETRQYMRVHWSGVLYWLSVDIALRQQGQWTLGQALLALKRCCANSRLSAEELVRELDRITDTALFGEQFLLFRQTRHLPDYRPLLSRLGVETDGRQSILRLNDDATLAPIRRALIEAYPLSSEG